MAVAAPTLAPRPVRFTVEDYYRMARAGVLGADDRVELIDGEVVCMSPIGSRHAATVDRLVAWLTRSVGVDAARPIVRCQGPLRLDDHSEPEPDITLLLPREDFYADAHPSGRDALLVIEVADSSLGFDREVKAPLFLAHGVPEVWIVDLAARAVEVHRRGATPRRRTRGTLSLSALPDLELDIATLFGR